MGLVVDEIGQYLIDQGLVEGGTGWELSRGIMRDEPSVSDQAVAVFEYAGAVPDARDLLDRPGVQIRVRGNDYDYASPRAKIEAIYRALHGFSGTLSGQLYNWIVAQQWPFPLRIDEMHRREFAVNFIAARSRN